MKVKELIGKEKNFYDRKIIVKDVGDEEDKYIIGMKGFLCAPFDTFYAYRENPIIGLRNIDNYNEIYNLYENDEIEFLD